MENTKIPRHIAIIMDGNGRWARERGLPRIAGHYKGVEVAEDIARYCIEIGVSYLTLFAFSTENWYRPKEEVELLFGLLKKYLTDKRDELIELGIYTRFIGRRDRIDKDILTLMEAMERDKPKDIKLNLILAIDYGGRDDIVRAVRKLINKGFKEVDEISFSKFLDLGSVPDPDLLIRTAGEKRISNFLLWNIAYTELYFTDVCWPDFNRDILDEAIEDFSKRKRKFGRILNE